MDYSKDLSFEQSHRFVEFRAENSTYANGDGIAEINVDIPLSSGEYLDMEDARLVFDLAITADGTGGDTYPYSASSWMERFSVRAHNQTEIGNQTNNYNRYVRLQKEMKNSTDNEACWDAVLEGASAITQAANAVSTFERAHKPLVNIFSHDGYYPAWAHKGFQIRIDLSDVSLLGANVASYTITNLRYECRLVKLKPEAHNATLKQLDSPEGIIFDFSSTEAVLKTIDTSTSVVYQFGRVSNRLKRVEVVEYTTGDHGNFQRNNITSYRYRLGSEYSTSTSIDVSAVKIARHVLHYMRAHKVSVDEMKLYGNAANTATLLASTRFVMANQMDLSKQDEVISSADSKGMDLEIHLTRSATATAGTAYLFKNEDRRLQILSGAQLQMLS